MPRPEIKFKVIIVEPQITREENERRFERVKEVLAKIALDMQKNGVTIDE